MIFVFELIFIYFSLFTPPWINYHCHNDPNPNHTKSKCFPLWNFIKYLKNFIRCFGKIIMLIIWVFLIIIFSIWFWSFLCFLCFRLFLCLSFLFFMRNSLRFWPILLYGEIFIGFKNRFKIGSIFNFSSIWVISFNKLKKLRFKIFNSWCIC
jgi:hypothetical protein